MTQDLQDYPLSPFLQALRSAVCWSGSFLIVLMLAVFFGYLLRSGVILSPPEIVVGLCRSLLLGLVSMTQFLLNFAALILFVIVVWSDSLAYRGWSLAVLFVLAFVRTYGLI